MFTVIGGIVFASTVICCWLYVLVRFVCMKKEPEDSEPAQLESATEVPISPKKPDNELGGASSTVEPSTDYGTGINGGTNAPDVSSETQPQVSAYALYPPGTQAASPAQIESAALPPALPDGNAVNDTPAPQQNLSAV
jgi:hypothetical protein